MSEQQLRASDALHARVRALIAEQPGETFERLAADVLDYQLAHVEPVRRLVRARLGGRSPASLDEVPALPTDVFRVRRVAAHPPELDARVFRTSGTTQGEAQRGRHHLRTLATYESAALQMASRTLWPEQRPARALILAPSAAEAPDSSLSFMIDLFAERLALPAEHLITAAYGLDERAARVALERASHDAQPTLVMGTAFAYAFLLQAFAGASFPLAAGSSVMLTGGFKGRVREVPESELRRGIERLFALEPRALVGEYGMTELSSQLYEPRLLQRAPLEDATYRAPPWLRVHAADPTTLAVLPAGEEGILRIADLANVDSALVIQTQDRARVLPGGDVKLLGRAPGAPLRGCSLALEELFGEGQR